MQPEGPSGVSQPRCCWSRFPHSSAWFSSQQQLLLVHHENQGWVGCEQPVGNGDSFLGHPGPFVYQQPGHLAHKSSGHWGPRLSLRMASICRWHCIEGAFLYRGWLECGVADMD